MTHPDDFFWKLLPIITSFLLLLVIYANARFGVRNKQTDVIIHFHKQFDELRKKRVELQVAQQAESTTEAWSDARIRAEADMFFDRFWSLQFDQFLAWYEGYIPTRLYVYWVFSRWRELHLDSMDYGWTFGGKSISSSLEDLKKRWQTSPDKDSKLSVHATKFLSLMFALKKDAATVDVDLLLRLWGPPAAVRWARRLLGAY